MVKDWGGVSCVWKSKLCVVLSCVWGVCLCACRSCVREGRKNTGGGEKDREVKTIVWIKLYLRDKLCVWTSCVWTSC